MGQRFTYVVSGNVRLRVARRGHGPLVLMVHGFPESWSSWRHQLSPIADAGFTAAALDVRGYGESDKPAEVQAYAMVEMVADLRAVADQLGGGRAILIGRDWGAPIVWNAALSDPRRFTAVAGMSIPHFGHGSKPLIDRIHARFTEKGLFHYIAYFQDHSVAETELEADVRESLLRMYFAWSAEGVWPENKRSGDKLLNGLSAPAALPSWLEPEHLDYLVSQFNKSGFHGPLNRYRNFQRDFEWAANFAGQTIGQPALFMAGEMDPSNRMFGENVERRMLAAFDDLRGVHMIPRAGHWNQEENPQDTNKILLAWLKAL